MRAEAGYQGGNNLWPRTRDLTRAFSANDIRAVASIVFLTSSAGLIAMSIPLPGYVDPDWLPIFIAHGVVCLLLAVITKAGYLSGAKSVAIVVYADLTIPLSVACLTDSSAGSVVAAIYSLPTLFIAIFMSGRWLIGQACAVAIGGWFVVSMVDAPVTFHLVRMLVILTSAVGPALFVLIIRQQLDRALILAESLATTDALTGLLNRRGLEDRFPALAARAARAGQRVGVIVADVDHFKRINDVHGHGVGDEVLVVVARTVLAAMRGEELAVRTGGEEMVIVAVADREEIKDLAERLRAQVEADCAAWEVTISAGATSVEVPSGADVSRLLWSAVDAADDLMYKAKRAGRNQVLADPEHRLHVRS